MLTTFSGTVGGQVRQVLLYIYLQYDTKYQQSFVTVIKI